MEQAPKRTIIGNDVDDPMDNENLGEFPSQQDAVRWEYVTPDESNRYGELNYEDKKN